MIQWAQVLSFLEAHRCARNELPRNSVPERIFEVTTKVWSYFRRFPQRRTLRTKSVNSPKMGLDMFGIIILGFFLKSCAAWQKTKLWICGTSPIKIHKGHLDRWPSSRYSLVCWLNIKYPWYPMVVDIFCQTVSTFFHHFFHGSVKARSDLGSLEDVWFLTPQNCPGFFHGDDAEAKGSYVWLTHNHHNHHNLLGAMLVMVVFHFFGTMISGH